jgi:hypothetical protein
MNRIFGGAPHVLARWALLLYVAYVAACGWAYVLGVPSREWHGLLQFLIEIACGLPWTLPLLAMPTILGQFDPRAAGEGFFTMVHVLAVLGVGVNLLVLNRLCDWRGALRMPFQVTS